MAEALLTMAGMAVYAGAALLALSQPAHWQASGGKDAPNRRQRLRLRSVGACLYAVAGVALFARDEIGFASLLCLLMAIAGTFATALTLALRPRLLTSLRGIAGSGMFNPSSTHRRSDTR